MKTGTPSRHHLPITSSDSLALGSLPGFLLSLSFMPRDQKTFSWNFKSVNDPQWRSKFNAWIGFLHCFLVSIFQRLERRSQFEPHAPPGEKMSACCGLLSRRKKKLYKSRNMFRHHIRVFHERRNMRNLTDWDMLHDICFEQCLTSKEGGGGPEN